MGGGFDMSIMTYASSSPYSMTPQTSWYISRFVFRPIPGDPGDTPVTLQQIHENRPDRLSQQLYGSPVYWWVFSVRNPFLRSDPIWGFVTGINIIVPSLNHLQNVLRS
jgi:hypothetical protein